MNADLTRMTVAELRAALDGIPDDTPVAVGYEGTWSDYGVTAQLETIMRPWAGDDPWFVVGCA